MPIKKADTADDEGRDTASRGEVAAELEMLQREGADSDDEGIGEPTNQPEGDVDSEDDDEN